MLAGIRRAHGRPPVQKEAIFADELLAMLAILDNDLRGLRDKAILAIGFAGGLRRSEIVGLDCGPEQTDDGTGWIEIVGADQNGGGLLLTLNGKTGWREVEIGRGSSPLTCPVAMLETWLGLGRITQRPGVSADRPQEWRRLRRAALRQACRPPRPENARSPPACAAISPKASGALAFSRPLPARRPRLLGADRGSAMCRVTSATPAPR